MKNSAKNIFAKLGGANVAAEAAGVKLQTAYRWSYPKERGGTGGVIPHWHHEALLSFAAENGKDLIPADFYS